VGYCEPNSLGGRLKNGEKEVRIFGETHQVRASVDVISSMSAHGDYDDLLRWVGCQDIDNVKKVFLVHGEFEAQSAFKERLVRNGFTSVEIPQMHETFEL
jgi:metallo-beta-lactamase family protein